MHGGEPSPVHRTLDCHMEIPESIGFRNPNPPPDLGSDPLQSNLKEVYLVIHFFYYSDTLLNLSIYPDTVKLFHYFWLRAIPLPGMPGSSE
jgi:hypothetical protein